MLRLNQTLITCDACKKGDYIYLDAWNTLRLPKGWKYRTRSWNDEKRPEEIQVVCSDECASKL